MMSRLAARTRALFFLFLHDTIYIVFIVYMFIRLFFYLYGLNIGSGGTTPGGAMEPFQPHVM